jgi:hypothetical protein
LAGPVLFEKIFRFSFHPNQTYIPAVPRSLEGRFAIVTDVERGMRWTLWRGKTKRAKADGEVVWS